jgi:subtilisin family serine protease
MTRTFLLFVAWLGVSFAQAIPGRYIIEFQTEPAAALSAARKTPFSAADETVRVRRTQIRAEHDAMEQAVRSLGGAVRNRFDTVFNGMAVDIDEAGAEQMRRMPNVRGVYPDLRHKAFLDHAVNVHKIVDAWKTLPGGQGGAGNGIKIGIIDSGIDINHPAFQGFSTAVPDGFPIVSSQTERGNTNNKVIVSRDYTGLGGRDSLGHGTGVAMAAAGLNYDPKAYGVNPFSGVAPGAWLGNYRVIDDNGGGSSSRFLQALQDAVSDGMNVVNYSAGGPVLDASRETGPEARAIDAAVAAGVLVVIAAGNNGPEAGTMGTPGVVAGGISVGANNNERIFGDGVVLGDLSPFQARVSSDQSSLTSQVRGPMADVTPVDGNGFACTTLNADSLKGQIALISRSVVGSADACSFDSKVNNAAAAGAIGAVIYDSVPNELIGMVLPTATLPAIFVTQDAGQTMKQSLASSPGLMAIMDFSSSTPLKVNSDSIPYFTSGGPTPLGGLKPDLLAVGSWLTTAYTTQDPQYAPVQVEFGTSFSAPVVTGAAAALMSARRGLTASQYRSLIVDSAPKLVVSSSGAAVPPQIAGSGKLDLLRAVQNTLAAAPSSVNFKTATGGVDGTQTLSLTNVGTDTDTFTVVVNAIDASGLVPAVNQTTFTLAPGASQTLTVRMTGSSLAPGEYHGFLEISGTKGSISTRVPYWLGVPGSAVKFIALQEDIDFSSASLGDSMTILFRTTDLIGMPIAPGDTPQITTTALRARVGDVTATGTIPGTYSVDVRMGRADADGTNVFTITAGGVSRDVTFFIE